MLEIEIPFWPPSLNLFAGRKNVWAYRKAKNDFLETAGVFIRRSNPEWANSIDPSPISNAVVSICFVSKDKRRRDYDNYLKFLLDALVHYRIIKDDCMNEIDLQLSHKKGGEQKIIIKIKKNVD